MDKDILKFLVEHTGSSLNPILSNLLVYETPTGARRAQAQNGRYAVDAPTDLPAMLVNADRLLTVYNACAGEPRFRATDSNLTVTAGRIRARVALLDPSQYPRTTPTEKTPHRAASLAGALRSLLPFVAEDASRPWATSICVTATHAYATNNVIMARVPVDIGVETPVNLPGASIDAILACGEIEDIRADELSVTFFMAGGVWVKCQLVSGEWPTGTVDQVLESLPPDWVVPHPELRSMMEIASKLADARHPVAVFTDGELHLEDGSLVADDLQPLPASGKVNAKMTALVLEKASEVQWHTPRPDVHAFRAGNLVGVFGGRR
jgi:hypothetical protein